MSDSQRNDGWDLFFRVTFPFGMVFAVLQLSGALNLSWWWGLLFLHVAVVLLAVLVIVVPLFLLFLFVVHCLSQIGLPHPVDFLLACLTVVLVPLGFSMIPKLAHGDKSISTCSEES